MTKPSSESRLAFEIDDDGPLGGLRKKSLSPSGALAAFVVGFVMMSTQVRAFGVSLIVFYLVGSRATKAGKGTKAALEEGHHAAGYRTASQVLCNSFSAFLASVLWTGLFVRGSYAAALLPPSLVAQGDIYVPDCLVSAVCGARARMESGAAARHSGVNTLASELGILATSPPILITTLARVPPGTNGGVSALGTAASVAGGAIMGLAMAATLALESTACRHGLAHLILELTLVGAVAGLFGSLIDSLMGATIQRTRYSNATKRILQDDTDIPASSGGDVKIVSGLNLLTNNQVNLVSSIITALATAYFA
ncbi:integral membrane protein DUF92-domain-containing protein [Phellopilus nigrolimitatus]|nr:integral membrane protein DUF92-domain-containing protein [Phellopilus nigrolimitatus]